MLNYLQVGDLMETIGIVCEYNPFHNGHQYHINKIKKLYPDSLIILVLNGYFLQRGEISLISKYDKTKVALYNNVDIVLELPAIFGTQSADTFAYKTIEILNYFQIDKIIFGSESNDVYLLEDVVLKQLDNNFEEELKKYLSLGLNYPTALSKACNSTIISPNDLLGISYIKAIKKINSKIQYETIKRTNSYHDTKSNEQIISASNIRHKLTQKEKINNYLPSNSLACIKNIDDSLFFTLLKYKILTDDDLSKYLDVDEGIENRLKEQIFKANTIDEFINLIKTKRYTYNKIKRMIIHILLSFKKTDNIDNLEYIKILGFNKKGQQYINTLKKDINISLFPLKDSLTYNIEQKAIILYDLLTHSNEKEYEKRNKPIII